MCALHCVNSNPRKLSTSRTERVWVALMTWISIRIVQQYVPLLSVEDHASLAFWGTRIIYVFRGTASE